MGVAVTTVIDDIPNECLTCIFQLFTPSDRKNLSLVCRRWLKVEARTHHRLCLALPDSKFAPSVFSRYSSLTDLTLQCPNLMSICDGTLVLISYLCPNLTHLEIRNCSYLSYAGLEVIARSCQGLKKFSSRSCAFGPNAIDALIHHCSALKELFIEDSCVANDEADSAYFHSLIRARNLTSVKIVLSSEEYWNRFFHLLARQQVMSLAEVHLEGFGISDNGLRAISKIPNLKTLHLVNTDCTDGAGLVEVAEGCVALKELHIERCRVSNGGIETLVGKCPNLVRVKVIRCGGVNVRDEYVRHGQRLVHITCIQHV